MRYPAFLLFGVVGLTACATDSGDVDERPRSSSSSPDLGVQDRNWHQHASRDLGASDLSSTDGEIAADLGGATDLAGAVDLSGAVDLGGPDLCEP